MRDYFRDYIDFGSRPISWTEHWSNGGTGISKGCGAEIAQSVHEFGDQSIWMSGNELHSSYRDLSKFWQFHRTRTTKAPSDPGARESDSASFSQQQDK
jgi:hypothetical protein